MKLVLETHWIAEPGGYSAWSAWRTDRAKSTEPKLMPETVMLCAAVRCVFKGETEVGTAASYVKPAFRVPTTPWSEMIMVRATPVPRPLRQTSDVVVDQDVVRHAVAPTMALGDWSTLA
jgi:hypothetical protein